MSSTPKIARSNSLTKFLEAEGNKVLSRQFITEEFLKDYNHCGVLHKMKNKQKVTRKERLCFIKYNRILYYYTMAKTPTAGTYLFAAQTASECEQWVQAIKRCLDECSKSKFRVSGQLQGTIIKGRDFAKKDLNGYADPFAITRIERQQIRTPTLYKTLNPQWNETFFFEITRNELSFILLVWDEDKFSAADFMGKIIIPLSALQQGIDTLLYLPLIPKTSKNNVTGDENPIQSTSSIFGHSLQSLEQRPEVCKDGLPSIIYDFVNYFDLYAMKEEGIFRICGSSLEIKAMKQQIDAGQPIQFTPDRIHTFAGVFKLYFRELPEPVLTFEKYDAFLSIASSATPKQLISLLKTLPKCNQKLLQLILPLLHKIGKVENSKVNMMNFSNLAVVFGPGFLRAQVETNDSILKLNSINEITRRLIEYGPALFEQ
eukprot:gene13853-16337_t